MIDPYLSSQLVNQNSNLQVKCYNANTYRAETKDTIPFTLFIAGQRISLAFHYKSQYISLDELFDSACYLTHLMSGIIIESLKIQGVKLACKKNCKSTCCKHLIVMSIPEALAVSKRIFHNSPHLSERSINSASEIENHIAACNENIKRTVDPEGYINEWYSKLNISCPFLSDEKHCFIYNDRPLVCRHWLVTGSPDHCHSTQVTPGYRIQMPFNMTNILMKVTSALSGINLEAISLHGLYHWYQDNRHLLDQKWPSEEVIDILLQYLLNDIKKNSVSDRGLLDSKKKSRLNNQPAYQAM